MTMKQRGKAKIYSALTRLGTSTFSEIRDDCGLGKDSMRGYMVELENEGKITSEAVRMPHTIQKIAVYSPVLEAGKRIMPKVHNMKMRY